MNGAHNLTSVRISRTRNGLTGRRHMSPRPRRATRKSCAHVTSSASYTDGLEVVRFGSEARCTLSIFLSGKTLRSSATTSTSHMLKLRVTTWTHETRLSR